MAKPIQFTSVNEVPLRLWGACLAIKEENKGESAVPDKPQQNKNRRKGYTEPPNRKSGESRQHNPEMDSAMVAIRFAPNFCESKPPIMQDRPPDAIIKNENSGIFKVACACFVL